MKNRALTFTLMLLLATGAGKMFADELVLLTPTSDKLFIDSTVTIKWDYTFLEWQPQNAEQRKLRIELYVGWFSESVIAEVDCNNNSYAWKVPALDQRTRRIVITMASKPSLHAMSPEFKITPRLQAAPFLAHAVKITVPQAGETYLIGSTMHIAWDTRNIADHPQVWVQTCWPNQYGRRRRLSHGEQRASGLAHQGDAGKRPVHQDLDPRRRPHRLQRGVPHQETVTER